MVKERTESTTVLHTRRQKDGTPGLNRAAWQILTVAAAAEKICSSSHQFHCFAREVLL